MWDDAAMALLTPLMGQLATEIPFYHLKNLPNAAATILTYETITSSHPVRVSLQCRETR